MERRTFLAAALSALAAPYLPAVDAGVKVNELAVLNAQTLTAALEQMFQCQMGPVAPVFAMVNGVPKEVEKIKKLPTLHPSITFEELAKYPSITVEEIAETVGPQQHYRYITYACAIEGGDAKEAEVRLANHFYDNFAKLPTGQLVWRIKPQFSSHEEIKWGVTYATDVQIEDKLYDLANLPEDAQYDIERASYRQVLSKTTFHKMRMRLVLPHLYDHEEEIVALPELAKAEGARTTRMI